MRRGMAVEHTILREVLNQLWKDSWVKERRHSRYGNGNSNDSGRVKG
jgi:hypothetical protein